MKKAILSAFVLIAFFAFPILCHASYIIHLKDGGRFVTARYWEQDGQIMFMVSGGTMGIDKGEVRKIEKSNLDPDEPDAMNKSEKVDPQATKKREQTVQQEPIPDANVKVIPDANVKEAKVDLKAYQDKMAALKDDLNKTLTRIRKATANNDQNEKDKATEENRKISDEMWKLTDELKAKTNGKLPSDWWEGVGREESATQ